MMSWAKHAIEGLRQGKTVQVRPRGNSMKGRVESGSLVTIAPCEASSLSVDDIVLVRVGGNDYLHLIKAIQPGDVLGNGLRFQIGNNRGRINGWVGPNSIYGKATRIEP